MVRKVRSASVVLMVTAVMALGACTSSSDDTSTESDDTTSSSDTTDPDGAATTASGPATGPALIEELVGRHDLDELSAFCTRAVGVVHPPDVHLPEAGDGGDRGLPVIDCGYSGRDESLFYTDDQDDTEYDAFFIAGFTTVDVGASLGAPELGTDLASACPADRRIGVTCVRDGDAMVAFDVDRLRDVFVHVGGATISLQFRNAGLPTIAEIQARALGAVEALGLELPDGLRDFQALADRVPPHDVPDTTTATGDTTGDTTADTTGSTVVGTSTTVSPSDATTCDEPLRFNDTFPLRLCDQGLGVQFAQEALVAEGYDIEVDGRFGSATLAAVKSFQSSKGLTADGLIGLKTWKALFKDHPLPFPDLNGDGIVTPDEIPAD